MLSVALRAPNADAAENATTTSVISVAKTLARRTRRAKPLLVVLAVVNLAVTPTYAYVVYCRMEEANRG